MCGLSSHEGSTMATAAEIRVLRERHNGSQEYLAEELAVSRSSLARWGRGVWPIPKTVGLAFAWIRACYREFEAEDDAKRPRAWQIDENGEIMDA
jgi:transcriptional regulator with XRE-family HTH domain